MWRRVVHPSGHPIIAGIMPGGHPPYVTSFTLLSRTERNRRPCGGVPSTVCSVVKPLRGVSSGDATRNVQNGEKSPAERHRRRATDLKPPSKTGRFLTFRVGLIRGFLTCFIPPRVGYSCSLMTDSPLYTLRVGTFLTFP